MALWFKLVEMKESRKDKDAGVDRKYTLKWQGLNADYMTITMKFEDDIVMQETLKRFGIEAKLGEQMKIEISPPKRLKEFEEEGK